MDLCFNCKRTGRLVGFCDLDKVNQDVDNLYLSLGGASIDYTGAVKHTALVQCMKKQGRLTLF